MRSMTLFQRANVAQFTNQYNRARGLRRVAAGLGAGLLGLVGTAHAALPAEVNTALTDMGTDSAGVAKLILLAIVAIVAFKFIRRAF